MRAVTIVLTEEEYALIDGWGIDLQREVKKSLDNIFPRVPQGLIDRVKQLHNKSESLDS